MKIEDKKVTKDLENILKRVAESKNISNYDFSFDNNPLKGDGFLSDFFTGEVLNKDNGKTIHVAIKKAPIQSFSVEFDNKDLYTNENNFYSKVFPKLDKFQKEEHVKYPFDNIPKYLTGSVESDNIFLAMENLKAEGYVLFEKKNYLDSKHIEIIFKTYGKFHALSFSFKQRCVEEYTNLLKNFTGSMEKLVEMDSLVTLMKKSFVAALDTFDPVAEADILAKLNRVKDIRNVLKDVLAYKGSYKCLIHGDCWSNNMLFKYKESGDIEDMKLIDFQLPNSSTPIHDLSYFFYSGASKQDMDKIDYYLDLYYQSFSDFSRELGEDPEEMLPLEVFKKEWKKYGLFGILIGCQIWAMKLMDKSEIVDIISENGVSEETFVQVFSDKNLKEPEFLRRARNICLHAVEYGIL